MTNFEKIKLITKQLQFFIDEAILNEENCSDVIEEFFSVMEILQDCNSNYDFSEEMEKLKSVKKVEVSICYVNMLSDILNIQKRNNYELLRKNGYESEYQHGDLQNWTDDILENFCKPLIKYDKDTEIILCD